jgi:5-methylcytosine-specific restriction endonuclease McrA
MKLLSKIAYGGVFLIGFSVGVAGCCWGKIPVTVYTGNALIDAMLSCIGSGAVCGIVATVDAVAAYFLAKFCLTEHPKKKSSARWLHARDKKRFFCEWQKQEIWNRQHGKCAQCNAPLDRRATQYDHIKQWARGGRTSVDNGQALCANCHAKKCFYEKTKGV